MSEEGINDELGPFLRMTVPRGLDELDLAKVEPGRLGRSWILLFGLLPVDYDDLGLESDRARPRLPRALDDALPAPLGARAHDRAGGRGRLHDLRPDRLGAAPAAARALLRPLFGAVFRHRHRRLRRHFGGASV